MQRLLWLFLCFLVYQVSAQGPADWWYFGHKAGIEFTSSGPIANTEGQMKTTEGSASIADEFGNLLFYTRGDTVWDSTHAVMQNGTGLQGNGAGGDGAMNAFIVPRPEHPQEYYIFSIQSFFGGMWYSKVDMSLNGGLGAVDAVEKNVPLVESTTEMVAAVRQPNNRDFWVIAMKKPGDTAFAYEVTPAGVNTVPVKSNTGLLLQSVDDVGYLRASQQSDKLAMTLVKFDAGQVNANGVHLFDVDNITGEVSFDLTITPSVADTFNYGVEFSPNGQFLYVQSYSQADCRQYDISSGVAATINASETLIGPSYTIAGGGALQLGPDGKIYVSRNTNFLVAAVEFPNNAGVLCGYNHDALNLGGQLDGFGFPQFLPFVLEGSIGVDDACFGDTVFFTSNYLSADSVLWDFGDPASGTADTSTLLNPGHAFTDTGSFTITHIAYDAFLADTTLINIRILPRQSLVLPTDTLLCAGLPAVFDLTQAGGLHYLWNGDTATGSFQMQDTGSYLVEVYGVCDTLQQVMFVDAFMPSNLDLGADTTVCGQPTLVIGDTSVGDQYNILWNGGETQSTILVDSADTYVLTAWNTCDTLMDTIVVDFSVAPSDSLLPEDTLLCFDDPFAVKRPRNGTFQFTWLNGSTDDEIVAERDTVLILNASNACGNTTDSMRILFNGEILTELGEDTTICDEDSLLLQGIDSTATYFWNTGATSDSIWTLKGETQRYRVTITKGQCQKEDVIQVTSDFIACPNINCDLEYGNIFTPNGDGVNDRFVAQSDCDIFRFDMHIFNRWGQLVHYSDNIAFGWDGYVNGEAAAEGTYYFVIEYKDLVVVDADRQITRGSFVLKR
jgi:gliding motility-associated-like protein